MINIFNGNLIMDKCFITKLLSKEELMHSSTKKEYKKVLHWFRRQSTMHFEALLFNHHKDPIILLNEYINHIKRHLSIIEKKCNL